MIYLTEGNTPLNEAYNDEIVHLGNNTYQLTFRFPTSDTKWELLKEETFLTADDLHGEQDFYIFEVEKQQGYIQVYANQVISLLNNYIVSSIEVDRVSGTRVLSAFAGSITRANPFSFFSDIDDRHTLNIKDKNAMEVLAKGKHSILGQWGGDMVRNGYNLRLLKNGGSENESLFMYKKNLSSYQHKTSTKSLKTRITFKTTVKGEGENAVDHDYMVVIDSPLLGNYSQIYEDVVEVNDQDVTDEASLIEYGKQYFRTSMCDMLEDNLEISVVGQSDVAVQMFDVVSFYHEWYGLDVRKKITKYTYSPMAKLLKSIGFGTFQSSLANAIGGIVNDAVLNESRNLHQIFEERLKKEIANADRAFDAEFSKREKTITDAIELAKAKAEEVKQELSDTINQRFNSFDNGPLKEAKRKAEEALRNAGASSSLAQESKRIGLDSVARLEAFKSQTTSAQTALSGDLDALKRTIANDIRPKQAQAEAEIAKQVEALSRTKNELDGASTLLAQEAKRIELDSVARLEAFKSQTTSAQTALSGDLDVLKRTIANDIRPKQAQAEAEIAKQVEALSRTKNELSGASTLLAQEAKRIELDSVARLEAFKSQTTSAQTALSGDLDVLKRTIANDIRPKQAQAEAEIAKQVEVLSRTKNELSGVKSAQATYEETTTRRLSELTNLANGKASKSELTQTAEELASRITSVQAGSSRNYFRNSRSRTFTTGGQAVYDYRTFIVPDFWKNSDRFKRDYVRISFDVTFPVALVNDMPAMVHFSAHPWYAYRNLIFKGGTVERQHFEFTIDLSSSSEDYQTNNVFIRFGTNYGFPAGLQVVIENAMLSVGNYFPAYQPAYEDQEDRVSVVESNFKQRADSLDAGVSRLTEGLRTKADISSLNVTAENIRQSVKSLETDTQNKLNQKLSQAEFEVRAGSIRQEILNATKDKASKSELTQTAEELASRIASVQASGRNLFLNSLFKQDIPKTGIWTTSTYTATIDSESKYLGHKALKIIGLNPSGRDGGNPKVTYPALGQFGKVIPGSTTNQDVTISFYAKANKNGIMLRSRLGNIGYKTGNVTLSTEIKRYVVHIPKGWTNESKQTTNEWLFNFNQEGTVWIWMPKFEISDVDTSYSEAPEDIEGQISTVESTFKQRANSLDAGVRSLTEGLRTKVDISALNVTAENIRQSVKSLETDTQNKLNQKLSQAEFEVRAGSIRQEILNATKDKASKSELTQTAEELASKIASVHLGRRNLLKGTKELARYKPVSEYNGFKVIRTVAGATRYQDSYVERTVIPTAGTEYIAIFYARASENDYPVRCHFYNPNTVVSSENSSGYKSRSSDGLSIIRLSTDWQLCWVKWTQTATDQAKTVIIGRHGPQVGGKEGVWVEICAPAIFEGNLAGDWSPAYEDQDERVSAVESNFKQRADSLEAGVSRLTEGLRTKADISSLNVTAENIRQSVKSLETDTQNKLNQKLSQAEFEVRAGSIRQEILNATKDKASKSELTQTAEELSSKIASVQVGGRNYIRGTKRMMLARGLWASGTFRPSGAGTAKTIDVSDSPATGFDKAIRLTSSNARDQIGIAQDGFYISQGTYTMSCWVKGRRGQKVKLQTYWQVNDNSGISPIFTLKDENWTKLSFTSARNRAGVASIGYVYLVNAEVGEYLDVLAPQLEDGSLATSSKEAPEDIEGQISTVESTFKQRADSLAAGVNRLTEGLRTKADISALNVTAENIRQSVKSLETDTQNKLNQKLSQAEFEVRAGSIRQEILNATKDKASKSELTQTAEELSSKIASVQASGRNLFLNSLFKQDISKTGIWTTSTYTAAIDSESKYLGYNALKIIGLNPSGRDGGNPKVTYPALGQFGKVIPGSTTNQDVTISFYAKANKNGIMLRSRLGNIGYKTGNVTLSTEIKRYVVHIPKGWTNESKQTTNEWLFNFNQEGTVWIWMPKFEISDVDTSYSEAPEDIEGQISTVESTFKQRANSLEAGVNRLTEGLRTKVDISALNVTAENIRQSVKSLETDTQNKLNQKLSQAEFEVRAGSIRQEILNATKDKASKSELTQTAEELSSKIASVQVGGINLLRNTASLLIGDRSKGCWMSTSGGNGRAISVEVLDPPKKMIKNMIRVIENTNGGNKDLTQLVGLRIGEKYTISCYARIASDSPNANVNLLFRSWANNTDLNRKFQKSISHKNWQKYSFTFTADAIENSIQFGQSGAGIIEICAPKIESGTLATDYSEAPEDIEGQISTVESTFKQRANSLDAGVSRLTEGLRTKVDISALNVTAENIRQSVKSLETDTQNKLNQKLSQAEFEVRAGSIRQEILNATKDKADKTLVVSEAGKLREEFSKMKVGGRNLWIKSKTVGAVIEKLPENHVTGQKECYRLENNSTLTFNLEPDFSSRLYQKVTFSAWIKYENVVQGRNFWNVFNCFKHYLFRKNSETGVQSGPDYATLGMYKGSADWKYITFTYDYSEKTNFDQLKTSLRFNLEGATSGTAWVTGIKVEIGSVATDWSPAPEDADGLITEAKATFERTAQGLRTDLSAIQEYVNKDGQRQEALQRYTREESARQATAVRELVNRDFVGKATYQEDVKGINQRIEAVKTSANKDIASQIASYRQSVDGKFTDISSQITTYKQDVGGQISGLSNRLTSSEQGTTTQISNLSNRINSNKQGTDNQISNLKTQVATNKDNAERQMGRISDQVSANKANADSQFANVTNQLARKVETTDFQRVKETSKLYERILGNTENGIADKVARMALTNQLFQVEVGKYSVSGPNLIKNSDFKNATNEWGSTQNLGRLVKHSFYHNGQKDLMRLSNATKNENFLYSHRFNLERNTDYVLNFRGFNNSALASYDVYILGRRAGESDGFTIVKKVVSSKKLSTSRCEDVSVTFNSGEMDNAYIRFDNNGSSSGTADLYITEVDLYKGYKPRTWQPHTEDAVADANKKLEATQTKMTQLAGSWVVENINSAGDIISGINLGANGHNRFVGKLTHITGETLIDRAVIKSAMVDKLKTANFEAGSVTTTILDAEAVTAEKLKVDDALIRKLTAKDAFIDRLTSKRIFSTKVESVISSSTFLEAYQGRIGGFTLGQFDQGGGRWISGVNQFSVGMGNGAGYGVRTAFWANWGNNWNYAGPKAWNVNTDGKMYCRNEVGFYDQVDFSNSSRANFYGNTTFSRSPVFSNGIELGSKDVLGDGWNPKGGRNAVVWWNQVGSGSVKYWMEQKSDRRLKENITDTAVKALDKINRLRMVAFDFIENKKHEEIGLIAQEAETIVPRIVSRDPENPDGYLHIDYTALVPYLIKAIQELNQKIEKMEKIIA
ncbi:TPA: tail fiber domain-containing protein [Streptococcus pneumoniae]|nr:tail fiber domain-containing protein [Streptococcus pneumoniae]HEU8080467.1 tail fiber domain-containing protein [Streptococcus pneumoniae]HEU8724915.1 tail fiber domain-containing protein [Streptococcus pneumoniae]